MKPDLTTTPAIRDKSIKIILIIIGILILINAGINLFSTSELRKASSAIKDAQFEIKQAQAHLDKINTSVGLITTDLKSFSNVIGQTKTSMDHLNRSVAENDRAADNMLNQLNNKLIKLNSQQADLTKIIDRLPDSIPVKPLD